MALIDLIPPALKDRGLPIITKYDLYLLTLSIIKNRGYRGRSLIRRPSNWNDTQISPLFRRLRKLQAVSPDPDFGPNVWAVMGIPSAASAEEVCCLVDPFCYISHLSAMQRLSLSDRAPTHLHITRPSAKAWKDLAGAKIVHDMEPYESLAPDPRLPKLTFNETIRQRPIKEFETNSPGIGEEIRGEATRISSIGRTFLDMLDQPSLCGGIHHVIDVWQENARLWLDEIIAEVSASPTKILKVRAGYILEERLNIKDPRISEWVSAAQRGGSSKLDPEAEYRPKFSERWMLSINA